MSKTREKIGMPVESAEEVDSVKGEFKARREVSLLGFSSEVSREEVLLFPKFPVIKLLVAEKIGKIVSSRCGSASMISTLDSTMAERELFAIPGKVGTDVRFDNEME